MKYLIGLLIFLVSMVTAAAACGAENAATPVGDPLAERPTLRCLGAYWIVRGDDNMNAAVALDYRRFARRHDHGLSGQVATALPAAGRGDSRHGQRDHCEGCDHGADWNGCRLL